MTTLPPPQRDNTAAVVVAYHPDAEFAARIQAIAGQVDRVLIVDNGSGADARAALEALEKTAAVELLLNDANLGIATALNQGCAWAARQSYPWALLFDQDSVPRPDMLERMGEVFSDYPEHDRLAVIGANHLNPASNLSVDLGHGRSSGDWVEKEVVITSGSLLALSAYAALGPFRDDFFIDEVDHEYCLRARIADYAVIMTIAPLLEHSLGKVETRHFLGRDVHPSFHAPFRWYYMTRNHAVVLREYLGRAPGWVLNSTLDHLKMAFKVLLFEDRKREKFAYAWRGLRDAMRGKMGKL